MKIALACFCLLLSATAAMAQVNGSGTANTVPVFTGTTTIGNSPIAVSGSSVGIGTASPAATFSIGSLSQFQVDSSGDVTILPVAATSGGGNQSSPSFALQSSFLNSTGNAAADSWKIQ